MHQIIIIMKRILIFSILSVVLAGCDMAYGLGDYIYAESEGNLDVEVPEGDNYADYADNPFVSTEEEPVSTFSVDADGASYANIRRFIKS